MFMDLETLIDPRVESTWEYSESQLKSWCGLENRCIKFTVFYVLCQENEVYKQNIMSFTIKICYCNDEMITFAMNYE